MEFINVDGGSYNIGWRFSEIIPANVKNSMEEFMPLESVLTRVSQKRTVKLDSFSISKNCLNFEDIISDVDDEIIEEIETIEQVCELINQVIKSNNWRLPTEDELEVALGPSIFPWGNQFPEGIPYDNLTTFDGYKKESETGLVFNSSTYCVEITMNAIKLGDGGEAVCGGYPWPIPWLSFLPCWRLVDNDIEDCFWETFEDAEFRVVQI